ncbi:hypothetical protein SAMN05216215_101818 [Saccharopolyspora shandongensis]|uniref:Uncharacterized protein n=2 Tax=Saccharopolyspora shandongensis TaxID=418495 RepID=A0A1H3G2A6_9PSEU|nr:hypothetical protein SAMN05216215_101818 [Saccharopolyspora shandongensis]
MEPAKAAEARFWDRMAELRIPDGEAWEALRVALAEIQDGAHHTDPWTVAVERLAADRQRPSDREPMQ